MEALVANKIAYWNKRYKEDDTDKDGIPKQPIAFIYASQAWRAVSFDETRINDKTHGEGGDRAGRTERIVRCVR